QDLDPQRVIQHFETELLAFTRQSREVTVLGFGKAAIKMFQGVSGVLGKKIAKAAIIIPEDESPHPIDKVDILHGTHPYPTRMSEESSRRLIEIAQDSTGSDLIFLVSGGGSAIFEVPADPFTIEQISTVSKCMMNNGADINELNCVRFAMSDVKGGKLAAKFRDRRILALYISDVPYDDLAYIASGPLVSAGGHCDPAKVLLNTGCSGILGDNVTLSYSEPVIPKDLRNLLVLRNYDFVSLISNLLRSDGCDVVDLGSNMRGDVSLFVQELISILRSTARIRNRGFWFVGGGETTVIVHGNGKGGRSQAAALHLLRSMRSDEDFIFLAAGTDGIDGQSPAMGAIVDSEVRSRVGNEEIDLYLRNDDSYTLLSRTGCSIMTGRTGNNVSDIFFGYYSPPQPGRAD
ncbi:glycerate kinase, partial [mine drainage metagenome]